MRIHSRLVLGVCGLALSATDPSRVAAAPPDDVQAPAAWAASPEPMPIAAPGATPPPAPAPHQHKGLFGWRHCVDCQRAYVKAHDGVDVPPPPGMPMQGGMVAGGGAMMHDPSGAGYAVMGPGVEGAPGYAVVGPGAPGDPAPSPAPE